MLDISICDGKSNIDITKKVFQNARIALVLKSTKKTVKIKTLGLDKNLSLN